MKRIIGIVVGIGFYMMSTPASGQDKVEQGNALFTSQKCTLCHSVAGKGNKKGALDDVGAKLKADEIRAWLTNPDAMREKMHATRTPMMKDPKLAKDQVDALVAFLSAQKNAAAR
jgi:mono/diheme cytochrome c family protein